MIHLEMDGERYPIAAGDTVIGSAPDSAVVLGGAGVRPRHAVVQGGPKGSAAIRAGDEAEVLVNGIRVGRDPTPLLHGDKIQVGGQELLVVDSARAGSTQFFDSGAFTDLVPRPQASKDRTEASTGGRLVCLTDGREYTVGSGPLTFGRDAGSNVVVTGTEVSRQHAEIRAEPAGYTLIDSSVNGTYVNGERIGKTRLLERADVIRVGHDEFRFYATAGASGVSKPGPSPVAPVPEGSPTGAGQQLSDTLHGLPSSELHQRSTPPSPAAAPLASLLFKTGELRGRRLPIKVPVVNIGRGDYNDVAIADDSVSTMHAKLQRRESIWILTDLNSTNGTFVEGERLSGEMPLTPGTTLRFGDIAALFEPLDDKVPAGRLDGTRTMERIQPDASGPTPDAPSAGAPRTRRPPRPIRLAAPRPKGPPAWLVTVIVIAAAVVAYLLLS